MATIIFPSPIFGPIKSRRLGTSLGINLLPGDGKICSFDCIYCECGFNATHRTKNPLPTREEVAAALEAQLQKMQAEGTPPDVLTFAGNGEPTLHPHFAQIIDDTIALRNKYFPNAKVCADSFHVLKHLTDDFRKVRIRFQNSTENPTLKYLLVKFRRAFDHKYQELLDNEPRYNKKLGQYINYRGIRDILFENFPILKVAFDLKEYYIKLNIQTTLQTAPVRIDEAISIFGNCEIL